GQADLLRRATGKKKASEMQKQRETFIDGATKNGVSQKVAENLFEQMVLFAEYCFNKSHSTAYAYVTYQTAFLKANYPVEYMAALLTANSGDQDKVSKYLANCDKTLNIKIEPPDINRSEVNFTPLEGSILFGLSAVKNLGEGAIENILAARKEEGAFKSLADLCDRVDLRSVNSRALEALIKCGAFDKIESNRKKLIEHLKLVLSWAQDRAKDRESGQLNLFDLSGSATKNKEFESAPIAPDVADFPATEKLQMEKELLGFYVSDHPLKAVLKSTLSQEIKAINLSELKTERARSKVTAIVMLTEIKQVTTKAGLPMAILQIEDLEDKAEAVVFPKTYETVASFLVTDVPVILEGKVDRKEDQTQVIVENIKLVEVDQLVIEVPAQPEEDNLEVVQPETTVQENSGYKPGNVAELQLVPPETIVQETSQYKQGNVGNLEFTQPETTVQETSRANQGNLVDIEADWVVLVELTAEQVQDEDRLNSLASLLEEYGDKNKNAKFPVFAMVATQHLRKYVRFGEEFWVENMENAVNALKSARFIAEVKQISTF
ncbi:MAG TPA: OB-fold nucleic acid binding domain-containing protein, partial [Candidatus Obscuribacterales bacterium]